MGDGTVAACAGGASATAPTQVHPIRTTVANSGPVRDFPKKRSLSSRFASSWLERNTTPESVTSNDYRVATRGGEHLAELEQNPFERVVVARERPGFTVEPEAIAWNAVAFKVRGQRDGVACVPRTSLASFLDDLDDGRLDEVIREFLEAPPSGRVLRAVAQTESPGLFDELSSPDAIVPDERRPGRPGRFGRGGGTPTGPRRDKRSRRPRPRPRRFLVAGATVAGVLIVAAVAVALQSNKDKDAAPVAAGRGQPAS
ncbi:MAG: hypothetical protein QOD38_2138, partial [Acidimicrobiaceae bacterium]